MPAAPFSAVFFDGRFVPVETARISVMDPGYLLGEGVFATMRGYDGVCFRPEKHLATLMRGAEAFGLSLPVSMTRLIAIADEAASRTRVRDAYVRVTLTRAADESAPAVLSVLARPFDVPSDDDYVRGARATIVTPRRIPPACIDPTVKTTSYAPQILARREAASRGVGAGEGIMLAIDGSLACGTMANLFLLTGNVLRTPSLASGCRAGVTREAVLTLAPRLGLEVREETIDPAALFTADEAFFTSTRVECLPIAAVDARAIGTSPTGAPIPYPRTTELRTELRAIIKGETAIEAVSWRRGTA